MPSYRVKISTSIGSRLQGNTQYGQFPNCCAGNPGDKFTFKSSCIVIECKRSNTQKKEEVENNPGNTIHVQIKRALLLYYAANVQRTRVYSISVHKIIRKTKTLIAELIYDEKNQPLHLTSVPAMYQFNLGLLMQNGLGVDSRLYETILSHWLGAWTVSDRYEKFARLWRCFEQLSVKAHHGAGFQEKQRLESLRNFIRGHAGNLPESCNHVNAMTYAEFRAFFWKLLIFNNFKRSAGAGKYEEYRDHFVLPYRDERVMQMLSDTLIYRTNELTTHHFIAAITGHLTTELAHAVKRNEDVVAILSGYYAYYTRNKIFHGEYSERSFSICKSSEDDIVDKLNALMEKVTYELIDCYQIL